MDIEQVIASIAKCGVRPDCLPVNMGNLSSLAVVEDKFVPLQSTNDDGTTQPALCWLVNGRIHVHPDRMELFKRMVDVASTIDSDAIRIG